MAKLQNMPTFEDPSQTNFQALGNSQIQIGRFSYGYENMEIRAWGEGASLNIGSFCSIAHGIKVFLGGNHRIDWASTFPFGHIFKSQLDGQGIVGHPMTSGDVVIGNDVWIGAHSSIMSGVSIGDGAVIAANSTVIKDVEPYEVVGGNPGKHIKKRFDDSIIEALLELQWWDLPIEKIKIINELLCQAPDDNLLRKMKKIANV